MSINSSIGWIGTTAVPFCPFYSSYLQQWLPSLSVSDIGTQINCLRTLKKLGTSTSFARHTDCNQYARSVFVFADAGRSSDV